MKVIIMFLALVNVTFAQSHDHHSSHDKKEAKTAVMNKKFKPSLDLKIRMDKIEVIIKEMVSSKNDSSKSKIAGEKIESTVNDIFKTCKLPADADEAIHPVLGAILDGADDLKNGKTKDGHEKIHHAVLNYEKIFSLK